MRYSDERSESSPRLGFGKYRGCRLDQIPFSYAAWLYSQDWIDADLRGALRTELAVRIGAHIERHATRRRLPAPEVGSAAREIIASGYRRLSLERHPDRGGSHDRMISTTDARDFLLHAVEQGIAE